MRCSDVSQVICHDPASFTTHHLLPFYSPLGPPVRASSLFSFSDKTIFPTCASSLLPNGATAPDIVANKYYITWEGLYHVLLIPEVTVQDVIIKSEKWRMLRGYVHRP